MGATIGGSQPCARSAVFSEAELQGLPDPGHVRSVVFDRWGDPRGGTGPWGLHPFGGEISSYATFDGLSIPSAGRFGWFFGTDRWSQGEFFRYQITELRLGSAQ